MNILLYSSYFHHSIYLSPLFFDVSHGLLVYETCAKITFLNGELDEKNYMEQLGRFIVDVQEQNVYV
jgi:hypothetical protein